MDPRSFDITNLRDKNYYSLLIDMLKFFQSKHYKEGDRLPQEGTLAVELNTNRSTLREMLRVLEVMGVIDSKRGSGNVYLGNMEVGFMNLLLISSMLSEGRPHEFSSIRASIEATAVDLFVTNASDADIYKLELLVSEHMNNTVDKASTEYLEAHIAFHEQIMKFYHNDTAMQIIRSNLRLAKRDYERTLAGDPTIPVDTKEVFLRRLDDSSHVRIVEAIKARDKVKARELVINHAFMAGMHKNYLD